MKREEWKQKTFEVEVKLSPDDLLTIFDAMTFDQAESILYEVLERDLDLFNAIATWIEENK